MNERSSPGRPDSSRMSRCFAQFFLSGEALVPLTLREVINIDRHIGPESATLCPPPRGPRHLSVMRTLSRSRLLWTRSTTCSDAISGKPARLKNALPNKRGSCVRRQDRFRRVLNGSKQSAKLDRLRLALRSASGCPHPECWLRNEGAAGHAGRFSRTTCYFQSHRTFWTARVGSQILSRRPRSCWKVSRRRFLRARASR